MSGNQLNLQTRQGFLQRPVNTMSLCCSSLVPLDSCCYGVLYSSCIQQHWLSSHSPSQITSCSLPSHTAFLHTSPPDSWPPYVSVSSWNVRSLPDFRLFWIHISAYDFFHSFSCSFRMENEKWKIELFIQRGKHCLCVEINARIIIIISDLTRLVCRLQD